MRKVETETPAEKAGQPASTEAAPAPVSKSRRTKPKNTDTAGKIDLSGMDDAAKFKAVKEKAMEDPEVKDLKSPADSEVDEAEAHKALTAYNHALFRKIRDIEPSLGDYSEKVEKAMNRRLGAEKGRP